MSIKKWVISELNKERASNMSEKWDLPFFLAMMLEIRGIEEKEEVDAFLSYSDFPSDPMLLHDMDKAVIRIKRALDDFEKICIYGDYDADGVTATALLYSYLESVGGNVMYYIPKREKEGYGLNIETIGSLKEQDVSLIITVDNGVVSMDEVEYAKSVSIDVVITDHHQPRDILPDAVAVVDPHRKDCKSPFKDLAGVGVAFKLVMALEGEEGDLTQLLENYSDLVAIGTIGDIVPIKKENRFFVKEGMKLLSNTDRPGLKALLEESGLYGRKLNTGNISFTIIPRINASGRMGSSDRAVKLLVSEYDEESEEIAGILSEENKLRQQTEQQIMKEVEELFRKEPERRYDRILVISGNDWHHGVIGIVASRISEKYGKPCIVISVTDDLAKGSGRSIEGFSLYEAILACSGYLTRFGGHPMAAGINMESRYVEEFRSAINEYAKKFGEMPWPVLTLDCRLNPAALSVDFVEQLTALEPYGCMNPKPLFALCNMRLEEIYPVAGGKHLRLTFSREGVSITAMRFSTRKEELPYEIGDVLDLAVTLDLTEYYGTISLSVIIRDLRLSEIDFDLIMGQKDDYEKLKRNEAVSKGAIERLLPKRDEFAEIYRYIRRHHGWNFGLDILSYRIRRPGLEFGKIAFILDIMEELGLIIKSVDGDTYHISLSEINGRVDLNSSRILKSLLDGRDTIDA